jgi:hypothetical protein
MLCNLSARGVYVSLLPLCSSDSAQEAQPDTNLIAVPTPVFLLTALRFLLQVFLEKKQKLLQISEGESFLVTGVSSSQMLIPVDNCAAVTMNDIELVFPAIEKEVIGVLWITAHYINVNDFIIGENFSENFTEIVSIEMILR